MSNSTDNSKGHSECFSSSYNKNKIHIQTAQFSINIFTYQNGAFFWFCNTLASSIFFRLTDASLDNTQNVLPTAKLRHSFRYYHWETYFHKPSYFISYHSDTQALISATLAHYFSHLNFTLSIDQRIQIILF